MFHFLRLGNAYMVWVLALLLPRQELLHRVTDPQQVVG